MKVINMLLCLAVSIFSLNADSLYDSIDPLRFDPAGYFATEQCLDNIFRSQEIKIVIELGSWAGASTRFFARRVGEGGVVYAIDHWRGSLDHPGEMTDPRLEKIYHLFLSNVREAGVEDRVIPMRMMTDEAVKAIRKDIRADLIYVDTARNSQRVYTDIMNWYPFLARDGIICGAEWREPSVRAAVQRAAQELGKEITVDRKGFFWSFR